MRAIIFGGTGTLAKHVIPILLQNPQIERLRLLSRGEHAQTEMLEKMDSETRSRVDFFIGDIRDSERVLRASEGCDLAFHFAAMKSIDHAEYNSSEAVAINILGTQNVISAVQKNRVAKAIFTSTDKAVAPLNIYGATKLCAEKLFIAGNIGAHSSRFSVVRYGNVLASHGSVISKWKTRSREKKKLQLTHEEMTRFFILPDHAAKFVIDCSYQAHGAEVFVPKMKSCSMISLLKAFGDVMGEKIDLSDVEWIGVRPGEKMHEVLISEDEISLVTEHEGKYIRWPNANLFPVLRRGVAIEKGFTSYTAERFTHEELKEMIQCTLV